MFNYDTAINKGSQYLVLKSTVAGVDQTAKKWTSKSYTDAGPLPATAWGQADRDLTSDERVIVIKTTFTNNLPRQQLIVKGGQFSTTFGQFTTMTLPHTPGDIFHVYGVAPAAGTALRMPFNRADYYLKRPANISATCAPNTGILYKAVANHADGSLFPEMPLLDCVADMQVVYGLDTTASGSVNDHLDTPPATIAPYADQAETIRNVVKEVRIYILAQEGKKDLSLSFPNKIIRVGESFGGTVRGRDFNLEDRIGSGWQNYRWKVYTIVVRPKNLIQ